MNSLSKSRRHSNRVWWKMVRKTHWFTKSDEIRANLGVILIGFRAKLTKKVILNHFSWFSKSIWKEDSPARFVFAIFTGKVNVYTNIDPNFHGRDSHSENCVNSEGVLVVVREKFKNETVATFSDVYGVSDPNSGPFLHFASRMKVNWRFKAKKEAFRERNSAKVGNWPFWLNVEWEFACEMKPVFEEYFPKPSAKPMLLLRFCLTWSF